jgi:hypothetical protein
MARARATVPAGDGELMLQPPFAEWAGMARDAAADSSRWEFAVAGVDARGLRALARSEAIERAREFSARLGVPLRDVADRPELIVASGHQPELYHPGVWVKDFLLQRLADGTGAAALDLVVDSDGFDAVGVHFPCISTEVRSCRVNLALGTPDGCFACAPVPSDAAIREFRRAVEDGLESLPDADAARHFGGFCDGMEGAAREARNLAELVTIARRRYESAAGSGYLELPVTSLARSRAFATFVAHLALDARGFAGAYNAALGAYRERNGTRSAAQPFPDLAVDSGTVELPLWVLGASRRTVRVRTGAGAALFADGKVLCDLGDDPGVAVDRLLASGVTLAPKAIALTLFARLFVADLFIHGIGGGRYDEVADEVALRYFGVKAPPFAVASLTVHLRSGVREAGSKEMAEVSATLNRLAHNPDQMLQEAEFETSEDQDRAGRLAAEKAALVAAIARPGADRKRLGSRIREVNAELAELLAPVREALDRRLADVERLGEARDVLSDRTYPFCFFDPREIADRAR